MRPIFHSLSLITNSGLWIYNIKLPLIYHFWKLGKSYMFPLTRENDEILTTSCLFISEWTLKIVFWEKLRKFVLHLKSAITPPPPKKKKKQKQKQKTKTNKQNKTLWCFCAIVLNSGAYLIANVEFYFQLNMCQHCIVSDTYIAKDI